MIFATLCVPFCHFLCRHTSRYIELIKGKYKSTALGREYISIIPEELKDPQLTNNFENSLKEIEEGKLSKEAFLDKLNEEQKGIIEIIKSSDIKLTTFNTDPKPLVCPCCGSFIKENDKSFYCSGYKEGCKFSFWKTIAGKKMDRKKLEELLSKGKTGKIKGFTKKDGSGKFDAFLELKDGKIGFTFK